MPRGGNRKAQAEANGKKMGRPKTTRGQRVVDGNVARRIKEQIRAEQLWLFATQKAIEKAKSTGNVGDLVRILEYLDDRDLGRPTENVNHMHDKPIEHTHTLELGEGMKISMQKAEAKLLEFRRA